MRSVIRSIDPCNSLCLALPSDRSCFDLGHQGTRANKSHLAHLAHWRSGRPPTIQFATVGQKKIILAHSALRPGEVESLADLVDQPIECRVELGGRLVGAGRDFGADAVDEVLADAAGFGGLDRRLGCGRNRHAVAGRLRLRGAVGRLAAERGVRGVDAVRAVDFGNSRTCRDDGPIGLGICMVTVSHEGRRGVERRL